MFKTTALRQHFLAHEHTQMIAYTSSSNIERKWRRLQITKKARAMPYCKVVELERKSSRRIARTLPSLLSPLCSIFEFEAASQQKHIDSFSELNEKELLDLASCSRKCFPADQLQLLQHVLPRGAKGKKHTFT